MLLLLPALCTVGGIVGFALVFQVRGGRMALHLPSQGVVVGTSAAVCASADRATLTQFSPALDTVGRASTLLLHACLLMSVHVFDNLLAPHVSCLLGVLLPAPCRTCPVLPPGCRCCAVGNT